MKKQYTIKKSQYIASIILCIAVMLFGAGCALVFYFFPPEPDPEEEYVVILGWIVFILCFCLGVYGVIIFSVMLRRGVGAIIEEDYLTFYSGINKKKIVEISRIASVEMAFTLLARKIENKEALVTQPPYENRLCGISIMYEDDYEKLSGENKPMTWARKAYCFRKSLPILEAPLEFIIDILKKNDSALATVSYHLIKFFKRNDFIMSRYNLRYLIDPTADELLKDDGELAEDDEE